MVKGKIAHFRSDYLCQRSFNSVLGFWVLCRTLLGVSGSAGMPLLNATAYKAAELLEARQASATDECRVVIMVWRAPDSRVRGDGELRIAPGRKS
jgi:hypothetical protein